MAVAGLIALGAYQQTQNFVRHTTTTFGFGLTDLFLRLLQIRPSPHKSSKEESSEISVSVLTAIFQVNLG